jgi:hypothetical protein
VIQLDYIFTALPLIISPFIEAYLFTKRVEHSLCKFSVVSQRTFLERRQNKRPTKLSTFLNVLNLYRKLNLLLKKILLIADRLKLCLPGPSTPRFRQGAQFSAIFLTSFSEYFFSTSNARSS